METYSQELTDYIASIVKAIKKGVDDTGFDITDPIVLDLAVVNSRRTGGGFDIFVVKGKGKYNDAQLSRLRISIKKRQAK